MRAKARRARRPAASFPPPPLTTFPSAVLCLPLSASPRSPLGSCRFQLIRLDSSARHPRSLGREPAIRILRTRSTEPGGSDRVPAANATAALAAPVGCGAGAGAGAGAVGGPVRLLRLGGLLRLRAAPRRQAEGDARPSSPLPPPCIPATAAASTLT